MSSIYNQVKLAIDDKKYSVVWQVRYEIQPAKYNN